jgi:hypothetical protein
MTSSNTAISVDGRKQVVPGDAPGDHGCHGDRRPDQCGGSPTQRIGADRVGRDGDVRPVLLVGSDWQQHQLDPGHQILRFGRREISQQQWFLGQRAGRVGHHIVSCLRHTARCNARVILSPQAKNLVFAASERDIEPRSFVPHPQDDTIRTDRVGLSRIDLLGAR